MSIMHSFNAVKSSHLMSKGLGNEQSGSLKPRIHQGKQFLHRSPGVLGRRAEGGETGNGALMRLIFLWQNILKHLDTTT